MNINNVVIPSSTEERLVLVTSVNFRPVYQDSRTVETLDVFDGLSLRRTDA